MISNLRFSRSLAPVAASLLALAICVAGSAPAWADDEKPNPGAENGAAKVGPRDGDGPAKPGAKDVDGAVKAGPRDGEGPAKAGAKEGDGPAKGGAADGGGAAKPGAKPDHAALLRTKEGGVFKAYDADQSGGVTAKEITDMTAQGNPSRQETRQIKKRIKELDLDGNPDDLNVEEFIRYRTSPASER